MFRIVNSFDGVIVMDELQTLSCAKLLADHHSFYHNEDFLVYSDNGTVLYNTQDDDELPFECVETELA